MTIDWREMAKGAVALIGLALVVKGIWLVHLPAALVVLGVALVYAARQA